MSAAGAHALAPVTIEPYALKSARPQLGRMEFQRLTEMGGQVQYWQHRDGGGAWRHGLPREVRSGDLRPAASPAAGNPQAEAPARDERPDRLDQRATGIMPGPLAGIRTSRPVPLPLLPLGEGATGRQPVHQALYANLPHMGVPTTMQTRNRRRPAFLPWHGIPPMLLPDDLPHYAAPPPYRARVAAPGIRLWYEVIMLVPPRERDRVHRIRIRAAALAAWLWPDTTGYRSSREGERLNWALRYMHNCRVPWDGGFWSAVVVKNLPDLGNPDTVVLLEVELPPRSVAGPLVYRPVLRHWGARSAAAWRLCIALAWMWNHYLTSNGKLLPPRLPVAGALQRNPLLKRLPMLDSAELVRLTAGKHPETMTKHARHNALRKARHAVDALCRREDLVAVWARDRVRLEPPPWWGQEQGEAGL
ncbi:MAG: hypothetical protein OXP66_02325 [Candidatus Tectomicrobia bacterium]|nr:hypothetical protein [Candidatus Tectomicrobia bacterium]